MRESFSKSDSFAASQAVFLLLVFYSSLLFRLGEDILFRRRRALRRERRMAQERRLPGPSLQSRVLGFSPIASQESADGVE